MRNCKDYICKTCSTNAEADDPFPTCMTIDGDEFETVNEIWFFENVIRQTGGCNDAVTAHIQSSWKAFHELLPMLTNRGMTLLNRWKIFKVCVRIGLLRRICDLKIKQQHSTEEQKSRLDLHHIEDILRWNRLQLSGHLYRNEGTWTKKIMTFVVDRPTFPVEWN